MKQKDPKDIKRGRIERHRHCQPGKGRMGDGNFAKALDVTMRSPLCRQHQQPLDMSKMIHSVSMTTTWFEEQIFDWRRFDRKQIENSVGTILHPNRTIPGQLNIKKYLHNFHLHYESTYFLTLHLLHVIQQMDIHPMPQSIRMFVGNNLVIMVEKVK